MVAAAALLRLGPRSADASACRSRDLRCGGAYERLLRREHTHRHAEVSTASSNTSSLKLAWLVLPGSFLTDYHDSSTVASGAVIGTKDHKSRLRSAS